MAAARVLSRASRSGIGFRLLSASPRKDLVSNGFHSLRQLAEGSTDRSLIKCAVPRELDHLFGHSNILSNPTFQRFGFSSTAAPDPIEEVDQSVDGDSGSLDTSDVGNRAAADKSYDAEPELSGDDLIKLLTEKEELLKLKQQEIEKIQDKVLRSYAEMENVIERTKREAENSKKFAIQNFAKSLLDVADNLGRASSVVKESFLKTDTSKDSVGAVPLLKTLLEGVEMTEKQLSEVFRKFGVEKFDPINENFDPNRHLAVFQVTDATKPPGTVTAVLKSGYTLHDRIIRPAEVGVSQAPDNDAEQSSSQ